MNQKVLPLVDGNDLPALGVSAFTLKSKESTQNLITDCLNLGIRHFELSQLFNNCHLIVEAINKSNIPRNEIFITYKIWTKDKDARDLIQNIIEELKLIKLSYVDLMIIHAPIDIKNRFDQWQAIEYLKDIQLTKSIGVSYYNEVQLQDLVKNCNYQPTVIMVRIILYHPSLFLHTYFIIIYSFF